MAFTRIAEVRKIKANMTIVQFYALVVALFAFAAVSVEAMVKSPATLSRPKPATGHQSFCVLDHGEHKSCFLIPDGPAPLSGEKEKVASVSGRWANKEEFCACSQSLTITCQYDKGWKQQKAEALKMNSKLNFGTGFATLYQYSDDNICHDA